MQGSGHQAIIQGLDGIIDYAGLFPPAALHPKEAVAEFLEQRTRPDLAWLFRRFVLPLSREQELREAFENQFRLSGSDHGIVPVTLLLALPDDEAGGCALLHKVEVMLKRHSLNSAEQAQMRARFDVELIEWQLPDLSSENSWSGWPEFQTQLLSLLERWPQLSLFVEQSWAELSGPHSAQVVEKICSLRRQQTGIGLKIRTGGLVKSSVPPPYSFAELIHLLVRARLPFKCTAGLHGALREVSPRFGFEMHGFLNVAVAVAAAANGADVGALHSLLQASTRTEILTGVPGSKSSSDFSALKASLTKARELFPSFGSCSVKEPYESLLQHGLLMN